MNGTNIHRTVLARAISVKEDTFLYPTYTYDQTSIEEWNDGYGDNVRIEYILRGDDGGIDGWVYYEFYRAIGVDASRAETSNLVGIGAGRMADKSEKEAGVKLWYVESEVMNIRLDEDSFGAALYEMEEYD